MKGLGVLALLLGAAATGYGLTGRPDLPARSFERLRADPPGRARIEAARPFFFDLREEDGGWVILANALEREGEAAEAVATIESVLRDRPRSVMLWVELGNALSLHAGGLPPAAADAFARAQAFDPTDPAPRYFRALALLRKPKPGEARAALEALAGVTPPGAQRALLEEDIALARASEAALAGLEP